jgi:hypothetical protein
MALKNFFVLSLTEIEKIFFKLKPLLNRVKSINSKSFLDSLFFDVVKKKLNAVTDNAKRSFRQ